jgi:hypothetical protein
MTEHSTTQAFSRPPTAVVVQPWLIDLMTEDPEDGNVALDEDESLPWPERDLVQEWRRAHAGELPAEPRVFMGAVPIAAPAWREQRQLAPRH